MSKTAEHANRWHQDQTFSAPNTPNVHPETLLRLSEVARLAFPRSAMTASGLRKKHDREKLVVFRIAGKDLMCLAEIEKMKERCCVEPKEHQRKARITDGRMIEAATWVIRTDSVSGAQAVFSKTLLGLEEALRAYLAEKYDIR